MTERHNSERLGLRVLVIVMVFLVACAVYVMRLVKLQIIDGPSSDNENGDVQTVERQVRIQAVRGQIYDKDGKLLVGNSYAYDMYLDYDAMPYTREEWNETLLVAAQAIETAMKAQGSSAVPFRSLFCLEGQYPSFSFSDAVMNAGSEQYKTVYGKITSDEFYKYYIKKHKRTETDKNGNYVLRKDQIITLVTPTDIADYYVRKYELDAVDESGEPLYTNEQITSLIRMYYDTEDKTFGLGDRILLASDVGLETVAFVEELGARGVEFYVKYSRYYAYPGIASHILGRIDEIYAEDWEHYSALGYPMDAMVGISGCEYAFEAFLHGTDGVMVIVEDKDGRVVDKYVKTEPIPGKDVYLTIDIDLQIRAEEALAETVRYTVENATDNTALNGEDCNAGAIVAVTPDGAVRAIASYPTYDLSTYGSDYASLSQDPGMPLYNRALQGLYAPGSTFKPGMALAALDSGTVTSQTVINCSGIYDRFSDYKPTCWIWNMYGRIHGDENAATALRDSCNCYFYEVGHLLGIETMNRYCALYGLGLPTGIELAEKTGVLAGPDYRSDNELLPWVPGDTVAAAIGQSDNLFNPLQIAMYTSFIANGGKRYEAHILDSVYVFGNDSPSYVKTSSVLSALELDPAHLETVRSGMYDVINDASVNYSNYKHFMHLSEKVAGKTGTAQVSSNASYNGLMTCFAPFESPELIVTCVLERGNSGSNCGRAIAAVYEKYFELKAENDSQ